MDLHKTKIAIISHASIKFVNRSVYRYLQKDVGELKLIIPSSIFLSSKKKIFAEAPGKDDPEIIPLELVGTNPRTYYYPDLIKYLDSFSPTVILLENDPVSRLGFQLTRWAKKKDVRIICQTYENISRDLITTFRTQGWSSVPKSLTLNLLNYIMSSRVNALLVINKDSEVIFNKFGYRYICRIPLGYDKNVFLIDTHGREQYRQKLNIKSSTILIGYFGRLVRQKGVHLLLQVLGSIKSLNWMLLLDHVHDSEDGYTSYIRTLIQTLDMEDRIIYFEADHIEIASYMRAADIMVAPSITTTFFKEQYGRTVQEAMACGCVSLVSDSGHLKDLVDDKALVFKEGDVAELTSLLSLFITNEHLRAKHSLSLHQRAASELTSECQAAQMLQLIERLK